MIDAVAIETRFKDIGARLKLIEPTVPAFRLIREPPPCTLDIGRDSKGQFFELAVSPGRASEICVMDCRPRDRHLLLMVRLAEGHDGSSSISRFLCGHDEREWFAAAVPEEGGASSVLEAKEALKPELARQSQQHRRVRNRDRNLRRNAGFVRQGEWFFIPEPDLDVPELLVNRREPLTRGRGKPHVAEFAYRTGGTLVYVIGVFRDALTQPEYEQYLEAHPEARRWRWTTMIRDPEVFVKGRVRHPDHKTIRLPFWHRVLPNTENQAEAMRHLRFLD